MKKLVLVLLVMIALASSSFGAKQRDWKDARLVSVSVDDTGSAAVIPIGGALYGAKIYQTNYRFETPDLIIIAGRRNRKPLNLTVNRIMKVATEKQNLYVLDDDGKEIKIQIVGKRAK